MTNQSSISFSVNLAHKLVMEQFPEYSHLPITEVEKQGHDNRTYRLGHDMLIRMPTGESYALKVPKEHELLPQLTKHLSVSIPAPIKMGNPSAYTKETSAVARKMSGKLDPKFDDANVEVSKVDYPYPFSIYQWLPGKSINLLTLTDQEKEYLAFDLAKFLKELHAITDVPGPAPGQHNWWRGDHVSVYDQGAREQISALVNVIDTHRALDLWDQACGTKWDKDPLWIHGDFAIGNILMDGRKLSAIIDFGGMALGDPACDLVIAWTYLSEKPRNIFMSKMDMDEDTWLRARAWALWKATFELCHIRDKNSTEAKAQKCIIENVLDA